jgi:murein DD-endopeptidase MepM/ murein hydrolase activator NlpD
VATGLAAVSAGAAGSGGTGGGIDVPKPPKVADATCLTRCVGLRKATVGATVEVVGRRLKGVVAVKFKANRGRIAVKPKSRKGTRLTAVVPKGAMRGRLTVEDGFGNKSSDDRSLAIKPASAIEDPGTFKLEDVSVSPNKAYFDGPKPPSIEYLFEAETQIDIRVDIIRRSSGETVRSLVKRNQDPFAAHTLTWDGLTDEGETAPNGKYRLRVGPLGSGGKNEGAGEVFGYYSHKFPLRGKHSYGDGLGAGRGHRGQDVFAKCGVPVVAARGGRVKAKGYQGAAGYYLVVKGRKSGRDYVYYHLKKRGRTTQGARVKTGEQIGLNGASGNASGCHLHFELWAAPGWFEKGGKVLNPTPKLRQWDGWS